MSDPKPDPAPDFGAPLSADETLFMANMQIAISPAIAVACRYRNYRGETGTRYIKPIRFWIGLTEWHPTPGLMLRAFDLQKRAERDFRVSDFDHTTLARLEGVGDDE